MNKIPVNLKILVNSKLQSSFYILYTLLAYSDIDTLLALAIIQSRSNALKC
ncbi:hypothetical protein RintRC_5502 [Richelia intracellularis]|nr:hypothetical protein RintRC_5502 [Richelia intracellularis]